MDIQAHMDAEANRLAQQHYEVEDGISQIIRVRGGGNELNGGEPIILLEVNENTVESGIVPIHFSASPRNGFDHPSIIIEITPEEYAQVETRELELPNDWTLGERIVREKEISK